MVPWSYCVVQPQKRSSWETYDRYPLVRDRVDRWTCTRLKSRPPTDWRSTYLHGCCSVATQCYDATPRHVVRKYESKNCQAQMRISPGDLSHHRLRRPETALNPSSRHIPLKCAYVLYTQRESVELPWLDQWTGAHLTSVSTLRISTLNFPHIAPLRQAPRSRQTDKRAISIPINSLEETETTGIRTQHLHRMFRHIFFQFQFPPTALTLLNVLTTQSDTQTYYAIRLLTMSVPTPAVFLSRQPNHH
jgi:hypothetical protein